MTTPQFDPLDFLKKQKNDEKERIRNQRRNAAIRRQAAENRTVGSVAETAYQVEGVPVTPAEYTHAAQLKHDPTKEVIKDRLTIKPNTPPTPATKGFWGNIMQGLQDSGELGAAAAMNIVTGLPFIERRQKTEYQEHLSEAYRKRGIPVDEDGRRADFGAWSETAGFSFMGLPEIPIPGLRDAKIKQEAYQKTDLPWGVKGAMEIGLDPLNVIPLGMVTKPIKAVLKGGKKVVSSGLHMADPGGIVTIRKRAVEDAASTQRQKSLDKVNNAEESHAIRGWIARKVGGTREKGDSLFRFVHHHMTLEEFQTQALAKGDKVRNLWQRAAEADLSGNMMFVLRPFRWAAIHSAKRISPITFLKIGAKDKLNRAKELIALSIHRTVGTETKVISSTSKFKSTRVLDDDLSFFKDAYTKNATEPLEGGASVLSHLEKTGNLTPTDLFGISKDGLLNKNIVEQVGKDTDIGWMTLFENAFTGIFKGVDQDALDLGHIVSRRDGKTFIKQYIDNPENYTSVGGTKKLNLSYVTRPLKGEGAKGEYTGKVTVRLTKTQAEYIYQYRDLVLDATTLLRKAGLTAEDIKVSKVWFTEADKLFKMSEYSDAGFRKNLEQQLKVIYKKPIATKYRTELGLGPRRKPKYLGPKGKPTVVKKQIAETLTDAEVLYKKYTRTDKGQWRSIEDARNLIRDDIARLQQQGDELLSRSFERVQTKLGDVVAPGFEIMAGSRYIPRQAIGVQAEEAERILVGARNYQMGKARSYYGEEAQRAAERGIAYLHDPAEMAQSYLRAAYNYTNDLELKNGLINLGMGKNIDELLVDLGATTLKGGDDALRKLEAVLGVSVVKTGKDAGKLIYDPDNLIKIQKDGLQTIRNLKKVLGYRAAVEFVPGVERGVTGTEVRGVTKKWEAVVTRGGEYSQKTKDSFNAIDTFIENMTKRTGKDTEYYNQYVAPIVDAKVLMEVKIKDIGTKFRRLADTETDYLKEMKELGNVTIRDQKTALVKTRKSLKYQRDSMIESFAEATNLLDVELTSMVRQLDNDLSIIGKMKGPKSYVERLRAEEDLLRQRSDKDLRSWNNFHVDDDLLDAMKTKLDFYTPPTGAIGGSVRAGIEGAGVRGAAVSDFARFFQTGFDMGHLFLQGLPLLFENPRGWGNAWKHSAKMMMGGSEKRMVATAEFFSAHKHLIDEMITEGGVPLNKNTSDFFLAMDKIGPQVAAGDRKGMALLDDILNNSISEAGGRAQAAFEIAGDVMRITFWDAMRKQAASSGPRGMAELGSFIRNISGSLSTDLLLVPKSQQRMERAFIFFSSRYTRASAAVVADALTRWGRDEVAGTQSRKALAKMAAGGVLYYSLISSYLGHEPKLDPRPTAQGGDGGDFMSIPVGDGAAKIGIGGFYKSFTKTIGKMIATDNDKGPADDPDGWLDDPFVRFMRGRSSPVGGAAWDIFTGEDYLGYPLRRDAPTVLGKGVEMFTPFWASPILGDLVDSLSGESDNGSDMPMWAGAFETVGLQAIPGTMYRRNELRAEYAQQEFPEAWAQAMRENPNGYKAWHALPQAMRDYIKENHEDLEEVEESINNQREIRAEGLAKKTDEFFGELNQIDDKFMMDVARVTDQLTKVVDHPEVGPLYTNPSFDLEKLGRAFTSINKAKNRAKANMWDPIDEDGNPMEDEWTLVREYLEEQRQPDPESPEPMGDIAYNHYIEDVVTGEFSGNWLLRREAEEKWENEHTVEEVAYVRQRLAMGHDDMHNTLYKEWMDGKYKRFANYFDDTIIEEAIKREPNSEELRELWRAFSLSREHDKDIMLNRFVDNPEFAHKADALKKLMKIEEKVKVRLREDNPELEAFLYRWGLVTTLVNPMLKDLPEIRTDLREHYTGIDVLKGGYHHLYLNQ